ncbi:branched-chain amino acid ABC transporter permease [Catellatospora citrea]|uniref:branched-chain amino acid ABC transporter permease n=1 Tax=Catellatospora citrea TaxID=53366 RepID=UPI0033D9D3B7
MSRRAVVLGSAVAGLFAAPWVLGPYQISLLGRMLAVGLLVLSVTLLAGPARLASLGQAAFFGVGAYTTALLGRAGTDVGVVHLAAAAAVAAVLAAVLGTVVTRTRGVVFLMLTLAVGELFASAAMSWEPVTHGSDGLAGVPPVRPVWGMPALELDGLVYLWIAAVVLLLAGAAALLLRSPYGLAMRGFGEGEARLRAAGYPADTHLLCWFVLAAVPAAVGGALWVHSQRFVAPGDLGLDVSALALMAAVIGGLGSVWGALAGAVVVGLLRDWLSGQLTGPLGGHGTLLLGAAFVLLVYVLPRGLAGLRARRAAS